MIQTRNVGGVAVLMLLLSRGAIASPADPSVKLKDAFQFGSHVFGPELKLEDLEGRVVLIEDWGYN
ncbi:MAG: hypothetical protein JXA90_08405 [Planctomycetes bacterium]|nr:hypothetical protein [Planctomycetota bacterium]